MLKGKISKFLFVYLFIFIISIFFSFKTFATNSNFSIKIIKLNQCMDNRDNDGDGKIDFPEDLDCTSPQDDNEDFHSNNSITSSMINITGKTIPNSQIKIFKDGNVLIYTKSDNNGDFSQDIYGFFHGNYSFGLSTKAKDDSTTDIINFNVELKPGNYVSVSTIFVAPTIKINDKNNTKDNISIEGYGLANSKVEINLFSQKEKQEKQKILIDTDKNGYYKYLLNIQNLIEGEYKIFSKNIFEDEFVGVSKNSYILIEKNVDENFNTEIYKNKIRCDLNDDHKVNLIDFSILLFYWLRSDYIEGDFNLDNIVDIKDFSIMAYNWTGY